MIPIDLADPAKILIAASTDPAFKSGIFVSASSFNFAVVICPATSFLEFLAADWIPAAFFNRSDAGGVFSMNVKDLSLYTEISTGITHPDLS